MPLFRQRQEALGQHPQVIDRQADLAALGSKHRAASVDEIADVIEVQKGGEGVVAQKIASQMQLQLARAVLEVHEGRASEAANGADQTTGQEDTLDTFRCVLGFCGQKGRSSLHGAMAALRPAGIRILTQFAEPIDADPPRGNQSLEAARLLLRQQRLRRHEIVVRVCHTVLVHRPLLANGAARIAAPRSHLSGLPAT